MILNNYLDYVELQRLSNALGKLKDFPTLISKPSIKVEDALELIRKNYKFFGYNKKPKLSKLKEVYNDGRVVGGGKFASSAEIAASYQSFVQANNQKRTNLNEQLQYTIEGRKDNKKLYNQTRRKINGTRVAKAAIVVGVLAALGGIGFGGFAVYGAIKALHIGWQAMIWAASAVGVVAVGAIARLPIRALWNKLSNIAFKHKLKVMGKGKGTKNELATQKAFQKTIKKEIENIDKANAVKVNDYDRALVFELEENAKKLPKTKPITRDNAQDNSNNPQNPPKTDVKADDYADTNANNSGAGDGNNGKGDNPQDIPKDDEPDLDDINDKLKNIPFPQETVDPEKGEEEVKTDLESKKNDENGEEHQSE